MGKSFVSAMETEGQNKHKRQELKGMAEEGEEDRISALPDCLLLEILSHLLCLQDAIKTGILSNRWKYLWTWVPCLIFSGYTRPVPDFFSNIDKTLTQCRQLKLKRFEMFTGFDFRFESQVRNWIRYAIRCDVERLHIVVCDTEFESELQLDQSFFISSFLTDLKIAGCKLNPTGAISWKSLRRLLITFGKLNEDLIENILSGSPVLETLVLNCYNGCRRLNITSKSVKNLVLAGYWFDVESILEINAPNILSLTIDCDLLAWKLLLVNVSSLVKANLDYRTYESKRENSQMLKGFIRNLSHVKELKFGDRFTKVLLRLEKKGFTFPSNIKFPSNWCDRHLHSGYSSDDDSCESE